MARAEISATDRSARDQIHRLVVVLGIGAPGPNLRIRRSVCFRLNDDHDVPQRWRGRGARVRARKRQRRDVSKKRRELFLFGLGRDSTAARGLIAATGPSDDVGTDGRVRDKGSQR